MEKSLSPQNSLLAPLSEPHQPTFVNTKAQQSSPLETSKFYWKTVKMSKITVAGVRQNVVELLEYS